ncbi:hypothetical protein N182_38400 [Sinorhizobium sp. GL2]|nr:hypothetical protein N182_38400 [Sinorhizobium sp. GL2]
MAQVRYKLTGQRNAQESKGSISLDFKQTLRQGTKPRGRQSMIEDEDAGKSVFVLTKICDDIGHPVLDERVASTGGIETIDQLGGLFSPRKDIETDAAKDGSRGREPVPERIFSRQASCLRIKRSAPQIGRKLGMLLAMKVPLVPCQAMIGSILIRQSRAHPARYLGQGGAILSQISFVHKGKLHEGTRRL